MPMGEVSIKPTAKIDPAYQNQFATNAAITITLPNTIRGIWIVHGLSWGYDGDPTGGRLSIAGGGFNYSWPVTAEGPGFIPLPPGGGGERSDKSSNIVITLAAAGAGVRGDLNVHAEIE